MKMKAQLFILWDRVKAVLRGKFITLSAYISEEESLKINNLNFQCQKWKKKSKLYSRKQKKRNKKSKEVKMGNQQKTSMKPKVGSSKKSIL